MEQIALDLVYHLADLQYEFDHNSGQRWPSMLSCQKKHILTFRSVCRAFRDASWIAFREVLAERIFHLNEEHLAVLSEMTNHARLAPLIKTLTFGSQVFTQNGLRILENGLEDHPTHLELHGSTGAWQRSLSSRPLLPYDELVQFKELYGSGLARQELLWSSGDALAILSDCLYRLSAHNLRAVRICPRPCHVSFEVKEKGRLSFSSVQRTSHWIPHGAVNNTRCNAWRNIDRTLTCLARLDGSLLQLHDLRTSSLSNIRWSIHSSIFNNTSLFSQLRTLQLSIREDILASDYTYAVPASEEAAKQFVSCLLAAPHLTSLDLEMCSMGEDTFASFALAHLSEQNVPYRLKHLALEYNVQTEEVLTALIAPHASTLRRLVLMNTWITEGSWASWLAGMRDMGVYLDYLEVWKPNQGGRDVGMRDAEEIFKLRDVDQIARDGNVVCCLPQEQWDNCYPRFARR